MSKVDVCRLCLFFLAHGIFTSLSLAMVCLPSLFIFPFTGHGMFAVFVNLPFPWPWDVCCLCSFALSLAMGCLLALFIFPFLGHGMSAGFVL